MQLGIGVYLGSVSGAAIAASGASSLLSGETQGLALDFTDDFYAATTGFYGSARIIDTGTPANNYDTSPTTTAACLLTYTSPSLKMTRGPGGASSVLRFQAHNLCVQSENFDNASWTKTGCTVGANTTTDSSGTALADAVIPNNGSFASFLSGTAVTSIAGATYRVSIDAKEGTLSGVKWLELAVTSTSTWRAWFNLSTGSAGSTSGSPSASGITSLGNGWHRCYIEVVAGTTSLTMFPAARSADASTGAVTGNGTDPAFYAFKAHIRRTPSDSSYLSTTTAARYALPLEWSTAGVLQGLLVEEARTNLVTYSDDLTNAAWVKTSATATKTANGPDGVANSASTLTATAGNATCLQSITSASAARVTSCYIKRRTGTGNIDMTQDNGTTWATVTVTSDWTRVSIAAATVTNPIVGLRIVTSGDAVDVALFDHEVGSFITSPKPTIGATAARAVDTIGTALPSGIAGASAYTAYVAWIDSGVTVALSRYVYSVRVGADSTNRLSVTVASNVANAQIVSAGADSLGTATSAVSAAAHKHVLAYDASSGNEAFDGVLKTQDTSITPPVGSLDQMYLGSAGGTLALNAHVRQFMIIPRRRGDGELAGMTTT